MRLIKQKKLKNFKILTIVKKIQFKIKKIKRKVKNLFKETKKMN